MASRTTFLGSLLICLFLLFHSSKSTDTLTSTQLISDAKREALLSSDGNFKFGFFSPRSSTNRYVGIWFNKVSEQTVVWVANRDKPLKNENGVCKITFEGNIAVFASENDSLPVWSSNISVPGNANVSAKLLSTGNLVLSKLVKGSAESDQVVWESFDFPTDTVLPGMKFGLDHRTGRNRVLTSWKSDDNPAPGEFSLKLEAHGSPQFFLYKNFAPYWRSGPWNGRTMNSLPEEASEISGFDQSTEVALFNYSITYNENEIYLSFPVTNASILSILVLEPLGTLQKRIWHPDTEGWFPIWVAPKDQCDTYGRCGPFGICNSGNDTLCSCLPGYQPEDPRDWLSRCVAKRKGYTCGEGDGEGFMKLPNIKVPDARTAKQFANLTLKDCRTECLRSCNCTGFASADINNGRHGCYAWYGELHDIREYTEDGQDFYLRVDAIELATNVKNDTRSRKGKRMFEFFSSLVLVGIVFCVLCFYFLRWKHMKKGIAEEEKHQQMLRLKSKTSLSVTESLLSTDEDNVNIELTLFDLLTIGAATDNFSPDKKLGQGGFGPVFKGQLPNGQEIAVKRLSKHSGQGIIEFKNEALLIAKLQHRNLVKLIGCCIENEEKMLIYEYMPNRSLDYFIFDEDRRLLLDWKKRHEIIVGIARGILYLHQDSRLRIIHRDLKASNILLDEDLNPKISDFGTARMFGGNQNEANTNRVVGTYGYMSPEYALGGLFSVKSDVFSFGVILLEIISGKRNMGSFNDSASPNLINHAWSLWNEERAIEIIDTSIVDSCPTGEVFRCIQVGLLCVQDNAADRPNMSSVVFMLSNEVKLPLPKQPTLTLERTQSIPEFLTTETRSSSVNEITITVLDAR